MGGKKRNSKKAETMTNSKKAEPKETEQETNINESVKDIGDNPTETSKAATPPSSNKRASKRTSANNNVEDAASTPKVLRRERREPQKEESLKSSDIGKEKSKEGREYEVEAIMGKRKTKGVEEFLVKWKGYSEKENSWEPKKNLNCQRLLDEFLQSKN